MISNFKNWLIWKVFLSAFQKSYFGEKKTNKLERHFRIAIKI